MSDPRDIETGEQLRDLDEFRVALIDDGETRIIVPLDDMPSDRQEAALRARLRWGKA